MRRAFTLIEALLALTLTGVLAAGCVTLLMEVTRARAELETAPILSRHTRGLGGFLEKSLAATFATPAGAAALFSTAPGSPPGTPPALHLRLDGMDELPAEGETRPTGEGWLRCEPDTGLVLDWRTDRQAKTDAGALTRTVLSPWVVGGTLACHDPERDAWYAYEPGRTALHPGLRVRLLLSLKRFGATSEIALSLDPPPAHAPAY